MAIVACKECGGQVSDKAAACPHCGAAVKAKASAIVRYGGGFLIGTAALSVLISVTALNSQSNARDSSSSGSVETTQGPAAPYVVEDEPLSKDAAAKDLAQYLLELHSKITAWDFMRQTYLSKLQQDVKWNALDKFRGDAEAYKVAAQKLQSDVAGIRHDQNLTDEDAAVFDALSSAADEVAAAEVMIAVDVSVYAHTGMRDDAEEAKDLKDAKTARKAYTDAAFAAYKHFGYPKNQIDAATLQIKRPER